ncbi:hypothetical protein P152DRAFT_56291 [Eremomyces bilateralis CBS 781.70]|uniref:Cyclic-AMP phosphodiesterase, class-II n=1 Tax=Eremomyces bilateralis CBS 781.70 TaxID=1392243 RepID=A0A6G1G0E3_9PEZI|nr:uncharacterized protein P152DRAFT_56291 [Eremomyces bilateralis CBS 781.70]KAF1811452.1 hypothetical protein P152DRAFT_56291 [Eremomyces bilateralis CBS 781.70]
MGSGKGRSRRENDGKIQVICLGSGGGPVEDNVTGFLVRSTTTNWSRGSVLAVDAGAHLASIIRILDSDFPNVSEAPPAREPLENSDTNDDGDDATRTLQSGPFAGLPFPFKSSRANGLHVVREHVATYLVTHPHLDHVSAFVMNTAAFHNTSRPKRVAALPFTVAAIKTHIFNDIIWPNLTDEDGGVGLVTFQRLAEGGNIALGEGEGRGYIEVCDGLAVKAFLVSHGHTASPCRWGHRGSTPNINAPDRSESSAGLHGGQRASFNAGHHSITPVISPNPFAADSQGRTSSGSNLTPLAVGPTTTPRRPSIFSIPSQPGTPRDSIVFTDFGHQPQSAAGGGCVVDSTAFFIRGVAPGQEILIFGDVEPDSLSHVPRNREVWGEAAWKIVSGCLGAVFIECSFTDDQADEGLFGHFAPRHLVTELQTLAEFVREYRKEKTEDREREKSKRKRRSSSGFVADIDTLAEESESLGERPESSRRGKGRKKVMIDGKEPISYMDVNSGPTAEVVPPPSGERGPSAIASELAAGVSEPPLKGLKVFIIHVKDTLQDGPLVGERILAELIEHERHLVRVGKAMGCEFILSKAGESYLI